MWIGETTGRVVPGGGYYLYSSFSNQGTIWYLARRHPIVFFKNYISHKTPFQGFLYFSLYWSIYRGYYVENKTPYYGLLLLLTRYMPAKTPPRGRHPFGNVVGVVHTPTRDFTWRSRPTTSTSTTIRCVEPNLQTARDTPSLTGSNVVSSPSGLGNFRHRRIHRYSLVSEVLAGGIDSSETLYTSWGDLATLAVSRR